jgi:hypothetical protein
MDPEAYTAPSLINAIIESMPQMYLQGGIA